MAWTRCRISCRHRRRTRGGSFFQVYFMHEFDPFHSPKYAETDKGPTLTIDQETVAEYLCRME